MSPPSLLELISLESPSRPLQRRWFPLACPTTNQRLVLTDWIWVRLSGSAATILAMAFLKLETTTAWAWLVAADFGESLRLFSIFLRQDLHYLRSREPVTNQLGHHLQRSVDVLKKRFVARTQVVQSELAIRCCEKSVLGTFPVAGKAHVAFSTDKRQRVQLVSAEFSLLLGADQVAHVFLEDVTQKKPRLDKVVARVQIAVMLEGEPVTAHWIKNAHAG